MNTQRFFFPWGINYFIEQKEGGWKQPREMGVCAVFTPRFPSWYTAINIRDQLLPFLRVHVEMAIPSRSALGNTGSKHYFKKEITDVSKQRWTLHYSCLVFLFTVHQVPCLHSGGLMKPSGPGRLCLHWSYVLLPTTLWKEWDQTLKHSTRAEQMLVLKSVGTCYVSCVTSL